MEHRESGRTTEYGAGWCDGVRFAAKMLGDRDDDWAMHHFAEVMECARYVETCAVLAPAAPESADGCPCGTEYERRLHGTVPDCPVHDSRPPEKADSEAGA